MPIARADARALEKLWEGWGRDKGLRGWGKPWLCNATGVECNARGRVTSLFLFSVPLQGTISSSIGTLDLVTLNLGWNNLTGTLPASIGNMRHLTSLYLSSNNLTGSLPASIGNLTGLTSFDLSNNTLTGSLPSSLENLRSLMLLVLNNNLTGSLPPSIGKLTNLVQLNASNNVLTGSLPLSMGE